ncbi:TIGR01459 family HAD-type hydrolase [Blastochloris sulfoviridis]|uniref:TIGR01459 family HAD-type hydrolase n=1 Tax=Blastochloris sulfoviridis TaxID=50712 RepID=A0A5M6I4G1_9HYPH|nr:TIGR01459 family HAD-type hydrolase [Blastochloris sulfoviridis]KAA5603116.1 TIGR01459 family HAD-type hydrolase [Blastochloris sulfoviridis]
MLTSSLPPMIAGLSALAGRYDVLLCDVWGVIHDGAAAHAPACEALQRFRTGGGTVVLVSNAPRPGRAVVPQLAGYGVPEGAFDAIVASGDVSRAVLAARPGVRVFHIGPDRDLPLFEGLDARRVPLDEAELVLCTGPWNDEVETPEDYRALLQDVLARRLMMVCGNPDVVVERGGRLIYCAGAIADLYAAMDGEVLYAGKPHPPIYRQALAEAAALRGAPVDPARVLAIGDSVRTDLAGAAAQGLDCLFILAGIHAGEVGDPATREGAAALATLFSAALVRPVATMHHLAW